jgi:histidyl-tRNA synthetase
MAKLNTSTPSGFPEFSPAQQRVIQYWKKTIAEIFEANGFPMTETPLVERSENFEAKGGNPKEIYVLDRLRREESVDQDKDVRAIRFDHTVPLALYVARHFNELAFPFRRSVIGPVMRGERAQKGRFRQFDQCDIDVIGSEKLSLANDAQMVAIIAQIFEKLMPEQKFVIRINNRKILTGFLASKGIPTSKIKTALDWIDNLEKIKSSRPDGTLIHAIQEDSEYSLNQADATEINTFLEELSTGSSVEILEKLKEKNYSESYLEGVKELEEVVKLLRNMKVKEEDFKIDVKIARGLDYYTGTVYETNLIGYEKLGSVCSGGRYDDLAKVFMGKNLPGVGISIGLTRLLWQLFEAKLIDTSRANNSDVIILSRDKSLLASSLQLGEELRSKGISTEVYMEDKKIQKQFDYAKKMGIPCRVIVGDEDTQVESDDLELKMQIENLI